MGKRLKEELVGRKYKGIAPEMAKELINLLDGYRINRFGDFRFVDQYKQDGKIKGRLSYEWHEITKVLTKMAAFPLTLKKVRTLVKISKVTKLVATLVIVFGTTIYLAYLYGAIRWLSLPQIATAFLVVIFISLGLRVTSAIADRRVFLEIEEHFRRYPEKFAGHRKYLKGIIQELINEFSLNVGKLDRKKQEVKLYLIDYERIEIVKKPGLLRKHYVVRPRTS